MASEPMHHIRPCTSDDVPRILEIINEAAVAYRGVIPSDRWHEPYMSLGELRSEIAAGVAFAGIEIAGALGGVMGVQHVQDVDLIRHAYVSPEFQRHGLGAALLRHLIEGSSRHLLVGTWADAQWAIAFYERNNFTLVDEQRKNELLARYWSVPARQAEVSVVLALVR